MEGSFGKLVFAPASEERSKASSLSSRPYPFIFPPPDSPPTGRRQGGEPAGRPPCGLHAPLRPRRQAGPPQATRQEAAGCERAEGPGEPSGRPQSARIATVTEPRTNYPSQFVSDSDMAAGSHRGAGRLLASRAKAGETLAPHRTKSR